MENVTLSVSDAIALINQTLDYAFPTLVVEGEVSGFKINQGKFAFFDIKDDTGTLGCFMMAFQLRVPLENGMRVQVIATPKLTAWGKFSLTVREVKPVGEGSLKRAFELLQDKLEKEGLFGAERKRMLPRIPSRIGVISSTDAAGYKDFIKVLGDRLGGIDITVAHTQVQGSSAPQQIIGALRWFNEQAEPVEVVVIVRGGGSADDLSTFNDEPLVRAIAASRVPTMVGVGHEVDTTLADMVADVRASTPTNAAQLLVPDRREVTVAVQHGMTTVFQAIERKMRRTTETLMLAESGVLQRIERRYQRLCERFALTEQLAQQLNPRAALRRGYALVFDASGKILGAQKPAVHDALTIESARYTIKTEVTNVQDKETK